jgi:hypothetical protein
MTEPTSKPISDLKVIQQAPEHGRQSLGITPWTFLLFVSVALLFAFPGVVIGTSTFFYRDYGAYCYPLTMYTRDALLNGSSPLWNPYSQCGAPHLAQLGQLYPPFLISSFLPMPWGINVMVLVHLLWAGLGMFWLTRQLGTGVLAAGLAGIAYVFNGVMLSSMVWPAYIAALSWLPWIIGCARQAWVHGGRWIVLAAFAIAFQVLSGMPELTVLTWFLLGALWIFAVVCREAKFWPIASRMGLMLLLAAGITMVQTLPFLDLLAHSQRNQNAATGVWSMPAWGWANLLVPLFHAYRSPQGPWFLAGQDVFQSYYPGAGILPLAIVGAWFTRRRLGLVFACAALLCWIMALGSNGYVYDWVKHVFPAMGFARFPVKFVLLPSFLLPILAAWGLDHVRSHDSKNMWRGLSALLCIISLLIGILVLFARQHAFRDDRWDETAWNTLWRLVLMLILFGGLFFLPKIKSGAGQFWVPIVLLSILPIDALTHSPNIAPTLPASALSTGMWEASGKPALKLGEGRVMIRPEAEQALLFSYIPTLDVDLTAKRVAQWYNFNILDHVPKVNGAVNLHSDSFDRFERYLYYTQGSSFGQGILDFLSVAWITSPENVIEWLPRTNYLPVMSSGQAPIFSPDEATLHAIMAEDFNPRSTVYLPEAARSSITVSNRTDCKLLNIGFTPGRVAAESECNQPSLITLSQTYSHLWRAFVDDKPTQLVRANLAFQALQVPAGNHRIELVFRDPSLVIGGGLSVLALASCVLLWFRSGPIHACGLVSS